MFGLLWYVGAFVIAIGVLVTIHELGHFLVARACGVKVLRFSLGFGKPIWRWQRSPQDTEWVLAAIPLGGYVKMLDEREAPVAPEELPLAFNRKPVARRIAVVLAGPLANFVLAVFIYWAIFVAGVSEPRAVLAQPVAGTVAAAAGFAQGDTVFEVDGRSIASWNDFRWEVLKRAMDGLEIPVRVRTRDGAERQRTLDASGLRLDDERSDPLQRMGLAFYRPPFPAVLGQVRPGSPAELAGLKTGDRVLAIDGQPVKSWEDMVSLVTPAAGQDLSVRYRRAQAVMETRVRPQAEKEGAQTVGRIGVGAGEDIAWQSEVFIQVRRGPWEALGAGAQRTYETAAFSLRMMGRMVTGEVSIRNISGPVTIADYAGQSARMGLQSYVSFVALISISIGVLNLLPIPLLDGGHIMYYLAEIALRRPVSQRVQELGQQLGFAVLAMLMAFAFINDITRLLS
ncbi:RIP metalloprotease RseP [Niveibacterium sp. SC-1]|uniref:RIP metalloprotease RseP n=1 Tax=Niveibacterium sp. SC-1 TaxID=3135646 RepID=UPI00311FA1C1